MKKFITILSVLYVAGCTVEEIETAAGETNVVKNENAIAITTSLPNMQDNGMKLASEHCGKYGKVAALESSVQDFFYKTTFTYKCL